MPELPTKTESVSISFPSWLIEALDDYCVQNGYTRTGVVTRAVRHYLWSKLENLDRWDQEYQRKYQESW